MTGGKPPPGHWTLSNVSNDLSNAEKPETVGITGVGVVYYPLRALDSQKSLFGFSWAEGLRPALSRQKLSNVSNDLSNAEKPETVDITGFITYYPFYPMNL